MKRFSDRRALYGSTVVPFRLPVYLKDIRFALKRFKESLAYPSVQLLALHLFQGKDENLLKQLQAFPASRQREILLACFNGKYHKWLNRIIPDNMRPRMSVLKAVIFPLLIGLSICGLAGCGDSATTSVPEQKATAAVAAPKADPDQEQKTLADNAVGKNVELWDGIMDDGTTFLGKEPEDINDFLVSNARGDKEGVQALIGKEKVWFVPGNTLAEVTESNTTGAAPFVRVRVRSGEKIGEYGWTPVNWVVFANDPEFGKSAKPQATLRQKKNWQVKGGSNG